MASEAHSPSFGQVQINPWFIAIAVMLATFMEVLDTSIAAVAVPYIGGSLSASNEQATWVLTSYLVANAVVLPASGWFSLRFGRKRFLIVCIVIFTLASFMVGASTSLAMILIARALQGAGGGALQPVSQAILLESFPPEKRGLAMAAFGFGVVVAPVLGPTLGGWITETYTWRWAFFINIPIGILAVILISRLITDPPYIRDAHPPRLDAIGLGLLAVWIGTLQIVLDKGQEDDWFGATWIRWATFIVITGLIAFLWREYKSKRPLVDLSVFRNRNFGVGCIQIALFGAVVYGMITILPLFFQTLLGYTALSAGLAVAPRGIGAVFAMPLVGLLMAKIDSRYLIMVGFSGVAVMQSVVGPRHARHFSRIDVLARLGERIFSRLRFRAAGHGGDGHARRPANRKREWHLQFVSEPGRKHRHLDRQHNHRAPLAVAPKRTGAFALSAEFALSGWACEAGGPDGPSYRRRGRDAPGAEIARRRARSAGRAVVVCG